MGIEDNSAHKRMIGESKIEESNKKGQGGWDGGKAEGNENEEN